MDSPAPQDDTTVLAATLPLPGTVVTRFIRCGKLRCRCRQEARHGPYYYRVWREGAMVRKCYVPPDQLVAVRAACEAYLRCQQELKRLRECRKLLSRRIERQARVWTQLAPSPACASQNILETSFPLVKADTSCPQSLPVLPADTILPALPALRRDIDALKRYVVANRQQVHTLRESAEAAVENAVQIQRESAQMRQAARTIRQARPA